MFGSEEEDKNKKHLTVEMAEKNEEISDKHSVVSANEIKLPIAESSDKKSATRKIDSSNSAIDVPKTVENGELPSAVKEEKLDEDICSIQAKEEFDKTGKTIKSSRDSLNLEKTDKSVSDKNGEPTIVNGVYEDLSPRETPEKLQDGSKPELVTVKEGYNLAAPKQKAAFSKEGQGNARLNDILANENCTEQRENGYTQQQSTNGHVSGLFPLEIEVKDKAINSIKPKSPTKEDVYENSVASLTSDTQVDDSNRKLQSSLELSDIPLAFNRSEAGKDSKLICSDVSHEREARETGKTSAERTQTLQNNALFEKGGKTDVADQSPSDKKSRDAEDDSPWILQLPQGGDLGLRKRNGGKLKNERNIRNEHKQNEVMRKQAPVLPTVTIDQSENEKHDLKNLNESLEERSEEDETPRRRSEPDISGLRPVSPLSPLMEDQESNSTFLHPSGAQSAKVKRNKSLVARGFSKMFGSKRKYKVDKEQKDTSFWDSDNKMTLEEFDLKENRSAEKKEKKKKKKESSEKKSDGQSPDGDEKSPRKFGGLFSRGKKKDKHSRHNERK